MTNEQNTVPPQAEPKQRPIILVRRKGNTPLRFHGELIGAATEEYPDMNDTYRRVAIYRAESGGYVAEHVFDANYLSRIERDGFASESAAKLIDWLRDEDGALNAVCLHALSEAATNDPSMKDAFGQDVA